LWFVATPPIVMLLAAIVVAGKPCPWIVMEVGAAPMKLKVVPALAEFSNATHGLTVYVVDADKRDVPPVALIVFVPETWSATTRLLSWTMHDPKAVVVQVAVTKDAVVKAGAATVTISEAPKPVMVKVLNPTSVSSGYP